MTTENKLWYTLINGRLYAFQSKHQRDMAGGEIISDEYVQKYSARVTYIMFHDFGRWYDSHKKSPQKR